MATSVVQNNTVYLDKYNIENDFRIYETPDGHFVYGFPIGTAFAALPIIAMLEFLGIDTFNYDLYVQRFVTFLCLLSIFSVMVRLYPKNLAIPCIFFFCTGITSTLCSALWSHDFAILFCLLAILQIKNKSNCVIIGLFLFLSYLCRPTFAVFFLCAIGYLTITDFKKSIYVSIMVFILLFIFSMFSLHYYFTILPPYYMPSRLTNNNFWQALYGNLLSPSRGLLIFSPFLLCINWLKLNDKFSIVFGVVWPILHLMVVSRFPVWWGGYSFGPRLLVDCLPGLYIAFYTAWYKPNKIYIIAIIFSFYINSYKARWDIDSALNWNKIYLPEKPADSKEGLFSWRHCQLLY